MESSSTPTLTEDPNAYQPATKDGPAKNVPVPEMPELAKQETAEGREAFMYYFFKLMDYTLESRDNTELAKYLVIEARYPVNLGSIAATQKEDGSYYVEAKHVVNSVEFSPTPNPNGEYSGFVSADLTELNSYKEGKLNREPVAEELGATFTVSIFWGDGKWVVSSMVLQ